MFFKAVLWIYFYLVSYTRKISEFCWSEDILLRQKRFHDSVMQYIKNSHLGVQLIVCFTSLDGLITGVKANKNWKSWRKSWSKRPLFWGPVFDAGNLFTLTGNKKYWIIIFLLVVNVANFLALRGRTTKGIKEYYLLYFFLSIFFLK